MSKQQIIANLKTEELLSHYKNHPGDAPYVGMEMLRRVELDKDLLEEEREELESLREEIEQMVKGLEGLRDFLLSLRPDLHSLSQISDNLSEVLDSEGQWDKLISGFDRHFRRVTEDI